MITIENPRCYRFLLAVGLALLICACDDVETVDTVTVHLNAGSQSEPCEGHKIEAWTFELADGSANLVTNYTESVILECAEDLVLEVDRSLPLLNIRVDNVPACPDVIPSLVEEVWVVLGGCPIPFPGTP